MQILKGVQIGIGKNKMRDFFKNEEMRTKWMIKVGSREDLGKRMSVYMRRWRESYDGERL